MKHIASFRPRFFEVLRGYSRQTFSADLMAGLVVGIVALPLAIAFGIASGVSPEKGIITAVVAGFVVSLLGGSRVQIGGPTGAFIVIVYGIVQQYGVGNLIIATALSGVLLFLMGLFKLGTLVRFIPISVIIGFTNGIAVLIALSQIRDWLGLDIAKMPGEIAESGSIEVDGVSGATITSNAIKEAAAAAITAAGLKPEDFQTAVENNAEPAEDSTVDTDIVIVGAGGAGMTAALTATSEGKSVVIVESQPVVGGNSVRATGGMNAGKTVYQDENEFGESAGVEKTLKTAAEKYADNETITALAKTVSEQWAEYQKNPTGYFDSVELMELDTMIGGKGINDPALVETLCSNSADAIDWLGEQGITLNSVSSAGGASVKRIHRPVNEEGKVVSVGAYMVPLLEEDCQKAGVQMMLNTTATEILTDDNGAAVGIKATGDWKGKVTEAVTTEYVNGVPRKTVAKFRAYDSYEDSFRDYAKLINQSPRYEQARAQTGSAEAYASALQKAGYATDPAYARKLSGAIQSALRVQRDQA